MPGTGHAKLFSTASQVPVQPSPESPLPSSHASPGSSLPSPHAGGSILPPVPPAPPVELLLLELPVKIDPPSPLPPVPDDEELALVVCDPVPVLVPPPPPQAATSAMAVVDPSERSEAKRRMPHDIPWR